MIFHKKVLDAFQVEPMDKFLTAIKDDEWKNVRSLVSTTFTSGKLKSVMYKEIHKEMLYI